MTHPLEAVLRASGIPCRVEARDRLAILIADAGPPAASARTLAPRAWREPAMSLARAHGFSHVALEIGDPGAGADLPGGARLDSTGRESPAGFLP